MKNGETTMECIIREWKIEDAKEFAELLSNPKILGNLRDGLPYPYTRKDAEEYISAMLSADKRKTFAFAIAAEGRGVGSIGVFRKAGFAFEGLLRSNAVKNGEVIDMKMYSLIKGEW